MGAGRGGHQRKHAVAACCVLCLLCHHGARCLDQQVLAASKPLADSPPTSMDLVMQILLKKFGDGKVINQNGLDDLLSHLKLTVPSKLGEKQKLVASFNSTSEIKPNISAHREVCQVVSSIRNSDHPISSQQMYQICPAILVQMAVPTHCNEMDHDHSHVSHHSTPEINQKAVWFYATGSIVIISACGLLAVAVIPIMQKIFYQQLLQFLVSLAVGSLCGDALLHLLPHAMSNSHDHSESSHGHSESSHGHSDHDNTNLWRGFVAMMGIIFFFVTEKCLTVIGEWRRRTQRKQKQRPAKVKVMRDSDLHVEMRGNTSVGEKLCKHKYSSYPYCYAEITGAGTEEGEKKPAVEKVAAADTLSEPVAGSSPVAPDPPVPLLPAEATEKVEGDGYTVILREHAREHHGHSHSHGHVHSAPHSLSSVAWMVVMGDGLHNLTDGVAIGAAFATGIPGGLSTALAVFCHELPHELGDFAVLLKAGMSAKQAVCYNLLSSALCFVGMIFGVCLGHSESATQWVFAAAAGMFLYIALVDMIPELTSGHSVNPDGGATCIQMLLLQLLGMITGVSIMFLIALYEEKLRSVFCETDNATPCSIH